MIATLPYVRRPVDAATGDARRPTPPPSRDDEVARLAPAAGPVAAGRLADLLGRRRSRAMQRVPTLTNEQLARTIRAQAYSLQLVDPYGSAVLDEAAERLAPARRW